MITEIALSEADPQEQLFILEKSLSGDTQVVVDILSRFLFESEVFRRRTQGPLSVSELKEIMADAQKQAYGEALNWTTCILTCGLTSLTTTMLICTSTISLTLSVNCLVKLFTPCTRSREGLYSRV